MDYIELQQKILNIAKNVSDESFIKTLTNKAISRREVINTYKFKNNKKDAEIIEETEDKTADEKKDIIYNYVDSCNSDEFLLELVTTLFKRIRQLKIDYAYDGQDIEDIEEEGNINFWSGGI